MEQESPTIVVVDDAVEVRVLVRTRIRVSGRLQLVAEGSDGAEAVGLARRYQPDLMLLDVSMPGMDGLAALPDVLAVSPRTKVVLFSGFEEEGLVDRAQQLGASAFVEKSVPVEELVDRLLEVLAEATTGSVWTPAPVAVQTRRAGFAARVDQGVLAEHLERFREVFDEAAIGMATMTLAGRLVRVNRALADLVEHSAEGLVGVDYAELADQQAAQLAAVLDKVRHSPVEVVHLEHAVRGATDGRQVRATLAPVRDSGGRALYIFLQLQDITAERAALEQLRRSEERFRLLVETVQDYAIFMLDPDGRIVSWNAGAQRSKGYSAEDIIGQHFRVFYPEEQQTRRHPEHELEIALRVGRYEEEGWRVRKDGTTFWANVVITAVFDETGRHVGFAKVTRDSTERRLLQEKLQQAADDQAKFLAVTAHELRTPIGVLGGAAQTLAQHWSELEEAERADLLSALEAGTSRLRRLLDDLLTASRLQASSLDVDRDPVSVADTVKDALATIARTWPGTTVEVDVHPDLSVYADRDRLAQVLDNLLGNALRHGAQPVRLSADADGDQVLIRVRDAGTGVPEHMQGRLFERFATGLSKGGTGLGLFIVRELARAQGGDARYEPAGPGEPAGVFVVALPRAQ
ncbi:MAG: PAS domain S-box protein [Nocardioides sp.]